MTVGSNLTPTLLAVAHGTTNPAGLAEIGRLLDLVRTNRPGLTVELCWLDRAEPDLPSALANLTGSVVIVPVLLSTGYHVKVDIPSAVAGRPATAISPPLGPDPRITAAVAHRLREVTPQPQSDVVLIASGSSDPEAAEQLGEVAKSLGSIIDATIHPRTLADDRWFDDLPQPCSVANYLLAPGHFNDRVQREAKHVSTEPAAEPIGAHPLVAEVILERYDAAARHLS
ncbi:MAG TPA: sirohydrochlorin chelatase [Jatrophihabitans sp.]|jgi:sirohydrochlorin ferrochelatase